MTKKMQKNLLNLILIFVALQPVFDIFSFLSIRKLIPLNISIIVKPLFVFGIGTYMLFMYSPIKKKWLTYIAFFALFLIGHFYILIKLLIPIGIILHEFRFVVNIIYMIALFIYMYTLGYNYEDKQEMLDKIKKVLMITFLIYGIILILSVLTSTSAMTYEYSDKSKLGYKGWFDSGQIFGHALSILFPILLYTIFRPQQKWYIKIVYLSVLIITVSLIGTKVPYYIVYIVLALYLIISIIIKYFNKRFKRNYFNIIAVLISIIIMTATYKYTPVAHNTKLNRINYGINLDSYNIEEIDGRGNIESMKYLINSNKGKDVNRLIQYNKWNTKASNYLVKLFKNGKVHPSDMRKKQFYYSKKKFELATIEYKIFGIGYLNQEETLALESDFFMAIFCFGILGVLLILVIPIREFLKATKFILNNIKKIDLETYLLYMGLGIFFCISIYAGYTYIYTNFSIFLVMLIIMLNCKIELTKVDIKKNKKIKKIDFLLLHLGFGGIESATINSANALCSKYDVRIISFYNLKENQEHKLNSKVKVIHLYNGFPNKEKFKEELTKHNIFGICKQGIKAVNILIKKKILVIKYIRKNKSDAIVSTRVSFSILLSKYGKFDTLKIAQEHHHHNNNKKYINKLKNKYYGIDYLCALTTNLYNDYEKILKNNNHTKIVLLPNMINDFPNVTSKLNNKNIITISRLDYGKKNDDIIKAFNNIHSKEHKLYIIGDGKEYNSLKELIIKLNLEDRVIMTGYLQKEEIREYMLKSDLFLMASLSEGLPMVLLEAMSYGIPCIAYETSSGINDIIDDGINGYIIKNRNESEYIDKINLLIEDNNKRKNMGKEAIKKSKKFSKKVILKIWEEILK